LIELVGKCIRCEKNVYCTDGFLNGFTIGKGNILCFSCKENDPLMGVLGNLLVKEAANLDMIKHCISAYPSESKQPLTIFKDDAVFYCHELRNVIKLEGGDIDDKSKIPQNQRELDLNISENIENLIKIHAEILSEIKKALTFKMDNSTRQFLIGMKRKREQTVHALENMTKL
jgi:hypothetical protein